MPARRWLPWIVAVAVAVVGVAVVGGARDPEPEMRTTITSDSMAPTLPVGATVRIDPTGAEHLARGDIVVFDDPGPWRAAARDRATGSEDHIAKRVIAVGGDELWCCAPDGRLVLDGDPLDEPYLPRGRPASAVAFRARVPPGHLWLMGDNRSASVDSRHLRPAPGAAYVPVSSVVGTVVG